MITPARVKREAGLLVVVVLKAQHLHDRHRFSKQDPFVEIEVTNSSKARTRADPDGGQTPLWDEEFRMSVYEVEGEQQYLHIRTMREESPTDHELIGEAKILLDGSWTEFDEWVAIKEDGKYRGEVYLELTWYPREDLQLSNNAADLQRQASRLDPATRLARSAAEPIAPEISPPGARDEPAGIAFVPRDKQKDLDFTRPSSGIRPPTSPPREEGESSLDNGRLPFPGEADTTLPVPSTSQPAAPYYTGSTSLPLPPASYPYQPTQNYPSPTLAVHPPQPTASPEPMANPQPASSGLMPQGSVSLPPRPPPSPSPVATPSGPPVPPRPSSAVPTLHPSHRSDPLVPTVSSSSYSVHPSLALPMPSNPGLRPSPSPPLPTRPESTRPLPIAPEGAPRPSVSPLEAKRREVELMAERHHQQYAPAPPAYSPSNAAASTSMPSPSLPGAFPSQAPLDIEAEARRSRELLKRRQQEEEARERERHAEAARRRAEEEAQRQQQLEAERQAAEERKRKAEQKRLEAIQASQRAREERIRQEEEDARMAARLAEEAEAAERARLAQRRAEDEALAKRLLAEEEAERARQQLERQRIDEDFVRQLREEDQQREDDERRAREEADAAFARRMREEEEAERRRRIEEDERVARSLAAAEQAGRQPPMLAQAPSAASRSSERIQRPRQSS
ncbi:hypothetical protein JCM10908_004189 [Rhodotorula pacifica]|uniref:uncharacterized protein n=1 Tax=Rhodotorula pacifica TaxID=1495444 RepID=UPI00316FB3CB